jgi:D-glycero-D-manno-heptose 1,7-bisphosphate phosphatase
LLLEASRKYDIDIAQSFFIGDAPSDLECAIKAGCQPVLLLTGRGKSTVKQIDKYSTKIAVFNQLYETLELIKNHKTLECSR